MASKQQMTGMLGVYLTAVELVKRGFIVSPTSRSAMGADLLVTDQHCRQAWSVQVKTNASSANFWLVGASAKDLIAKSHIYVFVNVPKSEDKKPQFYVVPSKKVAIAVRVTPPSKTRAHVWYSYDRDEKYRDSWRAFGDPRGSA